MSSLPSLQLKSSAKSFTVSCSAPEPSQLCHLCKINTSCAFECSEKCCRSRRLDFPAGSLDGVLTVAGIDMLYTILSSLRRALLADDSKQVCRDCLEQSLLARMNESASWTKSNLHKELLCPFCDSGTVEVDDLKNVIGDYVYLQLLSARTEQTVFKICCPNLDCATRFTVPKGQNNVSLRWFGDCAKHGRICLLCWASLPLDVGSHHSCNGFPSELGETLEDETLRRCPTCFSGIIRNGGCDSIDCTVCGSTCNYAKAIQFGVAKRSFDIDAVVGGDVWHSFAKLSSEQIAPIVGLWRILFQTSVAGTLTDTTIHFRSDGTFNQTAGNYDGRWTLVDDGKQLTIRYLTLFLDDTADGITIPFAPGSDFLSSSIRRWEGKIVHKKYRGGQMNVSLSRFVD